MPTTYQRAVGLTPGWQTAGFHTTDGLTDSGTSIAITNGSIELSGPNDTLRTNRGVAFTAGNVPRASANVNDTLGPFFNFKAMMRLTSLSCQLISTNPEPTPTSAYGRGILVFTSALSRRDLSAAWAAVAPTVDGIAVQYGLIASATTTAPTNNTLAGWFGALLQVDPSAKIMWKDEVLVPATTPVVTSLSVGVAASTLIPSPILHDIQAYQNAQAQGLIGATRLDALGHYLHMVIGGLKDSRTNLNTWAVLQVQMIGTFQIGMPSTPPASGTITS